MPTLGLTHEWIWRTRVFWWLVLLSQYDPQTAAQTTCNAGYYKQITPPTRCDYTFNVPNYQDVRKLNHVNCQIGTVTFTAFTYTETTAATTIIAQPPSGATVYLKLYFPSDSISGWNEMWSIRYVNSNLVSYDYQLDTVSTSGPTESAGIYTGYHFTYTSSTKTFAVTGIHMINVGISGATFIIQYDYTIANPIQTFTCTQCSAGNYCMNTTSQITCPIGNYCPTGVTAAVTCPIGSSCATTGLSTHTPCSAGTYGTETGATSVGKCIACNKGTYSTSIGLTASQS